MSTLIVRPPWDASAPWVGVWAQDKPALAGTDLLSWPTAGALPRSRELVLAVPAPLLSWHSVSLPKLPASRWRAALDGLLEDRLLTEPALLHLALGPGTQAGHSALVAACDRAWLQGVLRDLADAGRQPDRVVPEFEPGPGRLHLMGQPERGWLIEVGAAQVHALPLSDPPEPQLRAWRARAPSTRLPATAEAPLAALAEQVWGEPPSLMPAARVLQQAARSAWDLAQFDLAFSKGWHRPWKQLLSAPAWRPLRWALLGLLGVQVLGLQALAWKERIALQARQAALTQVLTDTFPQVTTVIDPVLQMEREAGRLLPAGLSGSGDDFTELLAKLGELPVATPNAIDYLSGQLRFPDWQPGQAAAPEVRALIERQGLSLNNQDGTWRLERLRSGP